MKRHDYEYADGMVRCKRCRVRRMAHTKFRWLYSEPPYGVWRETRPDCAARKEPRR